MDTYKAGSSDPKLVEYLRKYSYRINEIKQGLIEETKKLGDWSEMQISPAEGEFLQITVKAMNAKKGIEIGTFTGYSALCFALGLPEDGKLITCDVSDEWTKVGLKYWQKAGVDKKIDLRIAPANDTINQLLKDPENVGSFDFAFIDADKSNYGSYYEGVLKLLRKGGVIFVDNTIWSGAVADDRVQDDDTKAIRELNAKIRDDDRVDFVLLTISDGVTMCYKK